jgi:hypothetical protein
MFDRDCACADPAKRQQTRTIRMSRISKVFNPILPDGRKAYCVPAQLAIFLTVPRFFALDGRIQASKPSCRGACALLTTRSSTFHARSRRLFYFSGIAVLPGIEIHFHFVPVVSAKWMSDMRVV